MMPKDLKLFKTFKIGDSVDGLLIAVIYNKTWSRWDYIYLHVSYNDLSVDMAAEVKILRTGLNKSHFNRRYYIQAIFESKKILDGWEYLKYFGRDDRP